MNDRSLDFLDVLTIFSVLLQVTGYESDLKSASNDDLLNELQKQDREYLEKIIQNQNKILDLLTNLVDKNKDI